MLTEIRDRSSGWFAWIIAALIIIPMAFWGVNEYASTDARPVIFEIGDQKVYQEQFQQQLANQQQRAIQANPALANSDLFNGDFFKQNVLNSLVNRAMVQHMAAEHGYRIGDEQLATLIKDNPIFQTDGKFDPSLYENYQASSGLFSRKQFEDNIRESSRISQVSSGYQESALVLPDELRSILEIQAEKRTFDLITINRADYLEGIEVSDADIEQYYKDNTSDFMEDDLRSVEYVELDTSVLAEDVEVSDEEIQSAYDDYLQSFSESETRNTRHILLSTSEKSDDEQLAKANELIEQLRGGADFAELAKANSDDPGSAANGGSLGEVEKGDMVAEFEAATFAAEVGAISEAVKTQFGYHIIQVESINATEPSSLDEMRFELAEDAKLLKAEEIAIEKAEELRNLLFEQSQSLEGAASLLGAEVKTTEFFSRAQGEDIAENEAIRAAAFSEQVASEGLNSELIDLGNGLYVGLRQKEFKPSSPKPLADVSEQIKSKLTTDRATEAAEKAGADLLSRAEQDWTALAKDESVEIKTITASMIDTERKASPDVIREVTKMQLRDAATELTSFTGLGGDFNIIRLHKIEPGDLTQVSQQVKDATRRMLESRNGQSLFNAYLSGLQESLAPEINEDLL